MCVFTTHVVDVVLHGVRVDLGKVEVTLVDNLVVGSTVEQCIVAIGLTVEVGDVNDGVAAVHGGVGQVAAYFVNNDILFYHVLHIAYDAQVEIDSVFATEAFGIAVHVGRKHIFTRRGRHAQAEEQDKETYD